MSVWLGAGETAAGSLVILPPRASHPPAFQLDPFHHLWYIAPSPPTAKTSRRLGAGDATAKPLGKLLPKGSHSCQDIDLPVRADRAGWLPLLSLGHRPWSVHFSLWGVTNSVSLL